MPTPLNQTLYSQVSLEADQIYKKASAYKSGWIVKTYKSRGGKYKDDNKPKNLKRWFEEDWRDVGGMQYPVYRPIRRVSKDTPLTLSEIDKRNLVQQSILKQEYKGNKNLPPFKKKD